MAVGVGVTWRTYRPGLVPVYVINASTSVFLGKFYRQEENMVDILNNVISKAGNACARLPVIATSFAAGSAISEVA